MITNLPKNPVQLCVKFLLPKIRAVKNKNVRNLLKQLIDITLFLTKQKIVFKGHLENKECINQGMIFFFIIDKTIIICLINYLSTLI